MRKPTEWNEEPELREAIAMALEKSNEYRSHCRNDEEGTIEIVHEGRRFELTLSEVM